MKMNCAKHGEVEARVDKECKAWCPKCYDDMLTAALSTPEGKKKLSDAIRDDLASRRPFSMGTKP